MTDIEDFGDEDEVDIPPAAISYTILNHTDIESLENSDGDQNGSEDDDKYDLSLPQTVCEKITITDNVEGVPSISIEPLEDRLDSDSECSLIGTTSDVMSWSNDDQAITKSFDYEYPEDILLPFSGDSTDGKNDMIDKQFTDVVGSPDSDNDLSQTDDPNVA